MWARYGTQTASSFLGRDYFDTETGLRIRNTTQYDYDTGLYTLVSSGVISCSFDRDTVTVPEGIVTIEANALYSSLGKPSVVILPGGIESIGDSAICVMWKYRKALHGFPER